MSDSPGKIACPGCSTRVEPRPDGSCPQCGLVIADKSSGPAVSAQFQANHDQGSQPANPYESTRILESIPDSPSPPGSPDLARLESRIRQLEWRLEQSRLFSPNFFTRLLAVFGHWFLGYFMIACIFVLIGIILAVLIEALS